MPCPRQADPAARERGFTMVEIMVVLVVIAILMAVAGLTFSRAKSSSYAKETRAIAAAYDQVVANYMVDNANYPPLPAVMEAQRGPRNALGTTYLKETPDAVAKGRVVVGLAANNCATAPTGTGVGFVSYCPQSAPNYVIRAWWKDKGVWQTPGCYLGRGTLAGVPRCR